MIQDIGEKTFYNQYKTVEPQPEDYVFVFRGKDKPSSQVALNIVEEEVQLPKIKDFSCGEELQYLFSIDGSNFFLMSEIEEDELPEGFTYGAVREFRRNNPGYLCFAGMTAHHLFAWYRDHKFCGRCGCKVKHDASIRMLKCVECGNMIFPQIAPAVIIGLRDGDRIMMSRYAGREYKGRALLAGFCEIGETPEETVVREVLEEVGLRAKNVTYFGSQPWGFDSNLLLGYFCDLDGADEITLDEEELATASFVERDQIEYEDNIMSLTATMIEEFRLGNW